MNGLPDKKIKRMLQEAFCCFGMIAEAKTKCLMMKRSIRKEKMGQSKVVLDHEAMNRSMSQIRKDLAKYSNRILKIHEELNSYGVFSNMDKMA